MRCCEGLNTCMIPGRYIGISRLATFCSTIMEMPSWLTLGWARSWWRRTARRKRWLGRRTGWVLKCWRSQSTIRRQIFGRWALPRLKWPKVIHLIQTSTTSKLCFWFQSILHKDLLSQKNGVNSWTISSPDAWRSTTSADQQQRSSCLTLSSWTT